MQDTLCSDLWAAAKQIEEARRNMMKEEVWLKAKLRVLLA